MTFSSIVFFIIIALGLYYVGMIIWDMYKDTLIDKENIEVLEEEIDISSDLEGEDNQTTLVEVTPGSDKLKMQKKKTFKFPFPWTAEQLQMAFEKIELDEECQELENMVFSNKPEFRIAR